MSEALPVVYLARHGDTAWTHSGQHTGRIDLPLTEDGERHAQQLGERLKGMTFAKVFTSPLQRAARTCELAGFGAVAERLPDLVEWDYGKYEGLVLAEILKDRPDWKIFRDGCPDGNRQPRSASGRTASSSASEPSREPCFCFPADTSFVSSPAAGWGSIRLRASILC